MPRLIAPPWLPRNRLEEQKQQRQAANRSAAGNSEMGKPVRKTIKSGLRPPETQ
jgi:hypothetical protein